jgi:hypothetical protein
MLLLVAALCVQRLRTYDEPFQRDIMTYAVIGHELVLGNELYSDVLDHKPPAVYATFALAERLVGYGPGEVYLVNVLFGALAMAGLAAAAAQAAGPAWGLVAALFWLLFSYDLALHGNQPNTELCLNALLSLAFAQVLARSRPRFWLAGSLLALASLYKPVALVMVPLWGSVVLLQETRRGAARNAWPHLAGLAAPSVAAWAATFAYFWLDDRLEIFVTTVIAFNRDYAGSLPLNLARGLSPARLWPKELTGPLPLLALSAVGLVLGAAHRSWPALAVSSYMVGAVAIVAVPGQWWPYYYQVYLPPLVLGAVLGLVEVKRLARGGLAPAPALLLLGTFGFGLGIHLRELSLDADRASVFKHGPIFVTVRNTAARVGALLRPGERVFVHGIDPGIYFHTGQRPLTQALWINHLVGPLRTPLRSTLRRQIRDVQPELIVRDTRYRLEWLPATVLESVQAEYELLPGAADLAPFQLLVRRGTALHARLWRKRP